MPRRTPAHWQHGARSGARRPAMAAPGWQEEDLALPPGRWRTDQERMRHTIAAWCSAGRQANQYYVVTRKRHDSEARKIRIMPFVIGCLALAAPRVTFLLVVLFSNYVGRAYQSMLWPLLGFFFMPLTTL